MKGNARVEHVIVDAGAIIKGQINDFHKFGVRFYTTQESIHEIRDKKGREKLSSLPFDLEIKCPSKVATRVVSQFAQKSGDFTQLSMNDLKLLALTYDLDVMVNSEDSKITPLVSEVGISKQTTEDRRISGASAKTGVDKTIDPKRRDKSMKYGVYWNSWEMKTKELKEDIERSSQEDKEKVIFDRHKKSEILFVDEDFPALVDLASTLHESSTITLPRQPKLKDTATSARDNRIKCTPLDAPREKTDIIGMHWQSRTTAAKSIEDLKNGSDISTPQKICSSVNLSTPPVPSWMFPECMDERCIDNNNTCKDGDIGWITSLNIAHCRAMGECTNGGPMSIASKDFLPTKKDDTLLKVACLTTDFTMQNVLLGMKLNIISIDGFVIKRLRQWVLRCGACFQIHFKMDLLFCSKCGSNLMQRVASSIDDKTGKLQLHFRKGYVPQKSGTKYSLPSPGKQGRYDGELLLREDQLLVGIWRQKLIKLKKDLRSAFGEEIASDLGVHVNKGARIKVGLGHNNPNPMKGRQKRGKRKNK